jgi:hypothetical protein
MKYITINGILIPSIWKCTWLYSSLLRWEYMFDIEWSCVKNKFHFYKFNFMSLTKRKNIKHHGLLDSPMNMNPGWTMVGGSEESVSPVGERPHITHGKTFQS